MDVPTVRKLPLSARDFSEHVSAEAKRAVREGAETRFRRRLSPSPERVEPDDRCEEQRESEPVSSAFSAEPQKRRAEQEYANACQRADTGVSDARPDHPDRGEREQDRGQRIKRHPIGK